MCGYRCIFARRDMSPQQALTTRADCGQVLQEPLPGGWPEEAFFGDLEEEYKSFRALVLETSSGRAESGRQLLEGLLTNFRLDLCAVAVVRLVVASFLRKDLHCERFPRPQTHTHKVDAEFHWHILIPTNHCILRRITELLDPVQLTLGARLVHVRLQSTTNTTKRTCKPSVQRRSFSFAPRATFLSQVQTHFVPLGTSLYRTIT